jgi:mRNA-degrading endonuclease RelE of RelBE toxin-antitoxin system
MSYEVRLSRQSASYLRRVDPSTRNRIMARLAQLAEDSDGPYSKPLTNADGRYSSRIGGLRIIYRTIADEEVVDILVIAPRSDVYKHV